MRAKQIIDRFIAAPLAITGFSASGSSNAVTTPITTLLNTAGNGGVSVPLQPSVSSGLGVITTGAANRIKLFDGTSGDQLQSSSLNVYGKLTEASGVYTLSYFTTSDAGIESAFTFGSTTSINFSFFYRFDFARFPVDALVNVLSADLLSDLVSSGSSATNFAEQLTVTATNTIAALTKTPVSASILNMFVNEAAYDTFGGASAAVSVNLSTKAITWNPSAPNTGFSIETTDRVIARYLTTE
jgi:hypothetical protein